MIKKVYIDGLLGALQDEATKLFIKKDEVYIKFKEDQEENKDILKLIQDLGIDKLLGGYKVSIDFEYKTLEIHKGYDFKLLRNLNTDDLSILWTTTMVEIDTLMTREA